MKPFFMFGLLVAPVFALAATNGIDGFLGTVKSLMGTLSVLFFSAAVLFFFYNLMIYILKEGDDRKEAMKGIVWGIVILFVMSSVYGLVSLLSDTVNVDNNNKTISVPKLPS